MQEKEIERVGGTKPIPVDIRVIAATHRNLQDMVKANQFREDLWFRVNVFPIRVPPLRERKENIPSLVYYFINKKVKHLKLPTVPELSPRAIDRLMDYHWPGNLRKLENVVERELILKKGEPLDFGMLTDTFISEHPSAPAEVSHRSLNLDYVTAVHIQQVLKMTNGVVHGSAGAAAILGINANTLRSRMKKLGIPFGRKGKLARHAGSL